MPQLETLDGRRWLGDLPNQLAASNFPSLKRLTSHNLINWWDGHAQLPDGLEELSLQGSYYYDIPDHIGSLKTLLPPSLRSLTIGRLALSDDSEDTLSRDMIIHLPNLTHLEMEEVNSPDKLTLLWHLSAPALESLCLSFDEESFDLEEVSRTLHFKSLKEVQIEIGPCHPMLDLLLMGCLSITHLWIITSEAHDGIREFVDELAEDPQILPNLEILQVYGASLLSLRQVVQDRPKLRTLYIHALDRGLTSLATKGEFEEWNQAWVDLKDSVKPILGRTSVTFEGTVFYPDGMDRYQTWHDMKGGNRIDPIDWAEIDREDQRFWRYYYKGRLKELSETLEALQKTASLGGLKGIDSLLGEIEGTLAICEANVLLA